MDRPFEVPLARIEIPHADAPRDIAIFAFNRGVTLLGPRAPAAIIALMPLTASLLAIPLLDEWTAWLSETAICIIALDVVMAAASSKPSSLKGESR
jgi:drug/metabolite transporter (DMT)-like permease